MQRERREQSKVKESEGRGWAKFVEGRGDERKGREAEAEEGQGKRRRGEWISIGEERTKVELKRWGEARRDRRRMGGEGTNTGGTEGRGNKEGEDRRGVGREGGEGVRGEKILGRGK